MSQGPPCLLLVHGFASSAGKSWRRYGWVETFARLGLDVVAPDLPGHGDAPKYEDPGAYSTLEADLYDLVADRDEVVGAGFSAGGLMILRIEADHPGTFSRIAVGGVGANVLVNPPAGALANALESGDPKDAAGNPLAEVLVRAGGPSSHHQKALVAFLRRPNRRRLSREELSQIGCPILVAVGEDDAAAQPVERFTRLLQDPTILEIPGADHFGTMRSPLWLGAAREFLRPEQGAEVAREERASDALGEA
jgi:pimeloyl-ACP methyl ester carboxylesterase